MDMMITQSIYDDMCGGESQRADWVLRHRGECPEARRAQQAAGDEELSRCGDEPGYAKYDVIYVLVR